MLVLTPTQLVTKTKQIGSLNPGQEQGFASLDLKVQNEDILVMVEGPVQPDLKQSQFNPNKLQLMQDISGNGTLLSAFSKLRREVQLVLESECNPDYLLEVKSIDHNEKIYISWPRERNGYGSVFLSVDGKFNPETCQAYKPGSENFQEFLVSFFFNAGY